MKYREKIGHGAVIHELKSDPVPFQDIYNGNKQVEIRLGDRQFEVEDYILLRQTQWNALSMSMGKPLIYTGLSKLLKIIHVQSGYCLREGYVALSIRKLD